MHGNTGMEVLLLKNQGHWTRTIGWQQQDLAQAKF